MLGAQGEVLEVSTQEMTQGSISPPVSSWETEDGLTSINSLATVWVDPQGFRLTFKKGLRLKGEMDKPGEVWSPHPGEVLSRCAGS